MAQPNESTLNPGIILSAIITISPLIIMRKIPKVKTVIGKVKITKMGFKKMLSSPKIAAKNTAVLQ
jgi:hypothetical protein